jgi:hypothetical protein
MARKTIIEILAVLLIPIVFVIVLLPKMNVIETICVILLIAATIELTFFNRRPTPTKPTCSKCKKQNTKVRMVRECQDCGHSETYNR